MSSEPANEQPKKQTFKGSCHCGKVQYEFQHDPLETSRVTSCNCSICAQRGYIFTKIYDMNDFKFTQGSWEDLTEYRFGERRWEHWFCPVCGSGLFEKKGEEVMGFNLRAVKDVDIDKLDIKKTDNR